MDEKAAQTQSATTASARTSYGSTATDVSWQLDAGEAGAGRTSSDGSATGFSALSSESDIHADGHGNSRTRDWREQIETGLGLSMQLELPSFRRIVTVEPVIFLYMFGTFLQLLTQQLFVYNYFASEKLRNTSFPFPNHSFCLTEDEVVNYTDNATANDVQAKAAHFTLYYMVINLLFAMFVTTIYGALSDRFGRKPTLILAGLGAVLQGIVTVLLIYFNMNVYWLILAGLISGLSGGYATILAASFAYIADISSVRWRTLRIGLAESMIFAGGALGDGAGGYWFNKLNCYFLPPMLLFIASNFLLVLYVLILPESFDKSKRFKISERRNRKGLKFLLRGIAMFFGCVRHYSAWKLWAALIGLSILVLNLTGVVSIQNYFFIQHPLQWHANTTGLYEAISQVTHCIGLLVIFPVLVVLGAPDALIGLIGITASCAAQVFTGLVKLTWQMFLVGILSGVEAITLPSIRGLLSKLVSAEDQGALLSFVAAIELLSTLASNVLYNNLYPTLADRTRSGTVFFVMAGMSIIPMPLLVLLLIFHKYKPLDPVVRTIQDPSTDDTKSLLGSRSSYGSTQPN